MEIIAELYAFFCRQILYNTNKAHRMDFISIYFKMHLLKTDIQLQVCALLVLF